MAVLSYKVPEGGILVAKIWNYFLKSQNTFF